MQVLPVSSVANFQLSEGCRGARGRQKRQECRFPDVRRVGVRGRVRPRFFVGCGRLSTAAKMAAPHTLGRGAPSNRCGRLGLAPPQAARARAPLPHRAAKLAVASARRPYHAAATSAAAPAGVSCLMPPGRSRVSCLMPPAGLGSQVSCPRAGSHLASGEEARAGTRSK